MIIWIASYPKSGNTWIRSLVSSYLYSNNGEFNFDMLRKIPKFTQTKYFSSVANLEKLKKNPIKINEYWKDAQLKINLDKEIKFFKTHNACVSYNNNWFTDEINTAGYIYIVRDPRAVACSLAAHSTYTIDKSVDELLEDSTIGFNGKYRLAEISSSWKINYLSWKKKKKFKGLVIKYEDLVNNTPNEFKKILIFLKEKINIEIEEKKILKCVDSCKFSNLTKMEDLNGFIESTTNKFFRKGKIDSWKNDLNEDLRKKIEVNFKDEMLELGYI